MKKITLMTLCLLMGCGHVWAGKVTIDEVEAPEAFKRRGGIVSILGASDVMLSYTQTGDVSSEKVAFNKRQTLMIGDLPLRVFVDVTKECGQSILIAMEDFPVVDGGHYKVALSNFNTKENTIDVGMTRVQ
ncbi:MAG: hypothetical protein H2057_01170 [Alphaproteobacteria bacterium]|nr:hypothetical protein [Alphaproteobacteria bacterium]